MSSNKEIELQHLLDQALVRLAESEHCRRSLVRAINVALNELPSFAAESSIHKDIADGVKNLLRVILTYDKPVTPDTDQLNDY